MPPQPPELIQRQPCEASPGGQKMAAYKKKKKAYKLGLGEGRVGEGEACCDPRSDSSSIASIAPCSGQSPSVRTSASKEVLRYSRGVRASLVVELPLPHPDVRLAVEIGSGTVGVIVAHSLTSAAAARSLTISSRIEARSRPDTRPGSGLSVSVSNAPPRVGAEVRPRTSRSAAHPAVHAASSSCTCRRIPSQGASPWVMSVDGC